MSKLARSRMPLSRSWMLLMLEIDQHARDRQIELQRIDPSPEHAGFTPSRSIRSRISMIGWLICFTRLDVRHAGRAQVLAAEQRDEMLVRREISEREAHDVRDRFCRAPPLDRARPRAGGCPRRPLHHGEEQRVFVPEVVIEHPLVDAARSAMASTRARSSPAPRTPRSPLREFGRASAPDRAVRVAALSTPARLAFLSADLLSIDMQRGSLVAGRPPMS